MSVEALRQAQGHVLTVPYLCLRSAQAVLPKLPKDFLRPMLSQPRVEAGRLWALARLRLKAGRVLCLLKDALPHLREPLWAVRALGL
ncbi:MAG: hypothetical protein M3328_15615 [Chloroflexota bacterium]|nr:hypothetical protein [Chloroflexota bacterium]